MDEENVNIPVTTWIEPNIDEGRSRTDTVFVAFDEQLVDVKQDASITNLGNMWWWWYKEIVLTYTRKRTSPSKNVQASGPKLKNDTSWVNAVWNYMAKYYNAYLSNINTKKRTLRFSVPTEEDFKRLTRKAARFPDELQNEMLKDTGIYLEGLGLQTKSKAIMEFSDSAYTDSNLDTDSMTNATFGGDVLYILKEMKTDLNDIKRSIASVHSDVEMYYTS
ncbi:uncharacterized protein LOC117334824 [Pecten maximus]|uniref:uncharacterized protein LOC117334824 n=1 Tax=Pecten maximus TaxID=6579 RepID=UPI0014580F80|nr:uncharacterized protein LOC117334824 [Pecten maximus]